MESIVYQNQEIKRWDVGPSTFLALPEKGAKADILGILGMSYNLSEFLAEKWGGGFKEGAETEDAMEEEFLERN